MGIHRYVHFRLPGRDHPALQFGSCITGLYRSGTRPRMVYYLHHRRKRFGRTDLLLDRTPGQNGMDRKIPESGQETAGQGCTLHSRERSVDGFILFFTRHWRRYPYRTRTDAGTYRYCHRLYDLRQTGTVCPAGSRCPGTYSSILTFSSTTELL